MREKRFVEQNKEKWARFEQFTSGGTKIDPRELSELFSQITDDLSYARTHYSKRSIRVYLNSLAQAIFLNLYKHRKGRASSFISFWKDDLPRALFQARRELNISLLFFIGSLAIGVLSSIHDPDFAEVILGADYIDETNKNIENGDPMAIYKSASEYDMFFRITINNLLVAFRTFVLGAFFGVGTLVIMLYNGIMVGTFQYYFVERALFQESFLTIWMHGALEISAIVIAGGAGLTMGRGLLYPGTLPRMQSFQLGARRAIKIMIGLVPIFITAGFIEGFFTRLTELPDGLRGSFIFICFAFVGIFFWWLPYRKFRHSDEPEIREEELIPELSMPVELNSLRKNKEIFTVTFVVFRKLFPKIIGIAILLAAAFTSLFYFIGGDTAINSVDFRQFSLYNLYQFHSYSTFPVTIFLNSISITLIIFFSLRFFNSKIVQADSEKLGVGWPLLFKVLVLVTVFELTVLTGYGFVIFLAIVLLPLFFFLLSVSAAEGIGLDKALTRMLKLLSGTKRHIYITFLSLAILSVLLLFLIDSPFTWFYVEVLQWNIQADAATQTRIAILSLVFINHFGLLSIIPLILMGQLMEYYSAREALEAQVLEEKVLSIGVKRKAYGLERE